MNYDEIKKYARKEVEVTTFDGKKFRGLCVPVIEENEDGIVERYVMLKEYDIFFDEIVDIREL